MAPFAHALCTPPSSPAFSILARTPDWIVQDFARRCGAAARLVWHTPRPAVRPPLDPLQELFGSLSPTASAACGDLEPPAHPEPRSAAAAVARLDFAGTSDWVLRDSARRGGAATRLVWRAPSATTTNTTTTTTTRPAVRSPLDPLQELFGSLSPTASAACAATRLVWRAPSATTTTNTTTTTTATPVLLHSGRVQGVEGGQLKGVFN